MDCAEMRGEMGSRPVRLSSRTGRCSGPAGKPDLRLPGISAMLMVKTYLGYSKIHGFGLFAAEDISTGALVWQHGLIDQEFTKEQIDSLPAVVKQFVGHFGSEIEPGVFSLCGDNARFMNHSLEPNISSAGLRGFALRDIAAGEEITCDYGEFELSLREDCRSAGRNGKAHLRSALEKQNSFA
jgi:uncharacterized protein